MRQSDLFLTAAARRLIIPRAWQCTFLRNRAFDNARVVEDLEKAGDEKSAETYFDAVIADLDLDEQLAAVRAAC